MPYIIRYQYNGGPEQAIELAEIPESEHEIRLQIQESIDAGIIPMNSSLAEWHAVHSGFIKILGISQTEAPRLSWRPVGLS